MSSNKNSILEYSDSNDNSESWSDKTSFDSLSCPKYYFRLDSSNTGTGYNRFDPKSQPTGYGFIATHGEFILFASNYAAIRVPRQLSKELLFNLDRLEEIKKLKQDWNGNGAEPFGQDLVNKTIVILKGLSDQPQVFPTARNSIQLEYENGDCYLEFEIFGDRISVLLSFGEIEEELDIDESKIQHYVDRFLEYVN